MNKAVLNLMCLAIACLGKRMSDKSDVLKEISEHTSTEQKFPEPSSRVYGFPVSSKHVQHLNVLGKTLAAPPANAAPLKFAKALQMRMERPEPMPVIIAPSVAEADMLNLGTELEAAVSGGADWLHFSVQDGNFVPQMGIGSPIVAAAKQAFPSTVVDVELEVMEPENRLSEFAKAGADVITFHADATNQPEELVEAIREAGLMPGLVLNPDKPVSSLPNVEVDVIVVKMEIPELRGTYYPDAIQKIREIYAMCAENKEHVPYIVVEGGVSTEVSRQLIDAGANVLVAGHSIFSAKDKKAAIDALRK